MQKYAYMNSISVDGYQLIRQRRKTLLGTLSLILLLFFFFVRSSTLGIFFSLGRFCV